MNDFPEIDQSQVNESMEECLRPFHESEGENPYAISEDLQKMMQHKVGIVRSKKELEEA